MLFPSWANLISNSDLNASEVWLFEADPLVHDRKEQALAEKEHLNL